MLTFINWNPKCYNPPFLTISRNFKIKCRFVGRNARLWPSMYTNEGKKIYKWLHSSETNFFFLQVPVEIITTSYFFFFLVKRVKSIAKLSLYWIAYPVRENFQFCVERGCRITVTQRSKNFRIVNYSTNTCKQSARSFCWVVGKHGTICQKVHSIINAIAFVAWCIHNQSII